MNERPILERAFELARSGAFTEVKALDKALAREGYARGDPHTHSPTARKQLRRLCREAKVRQGQYSRHAVDHTHAGDQSIGGA
jgi:hypothetical protein